MWAREGVNDLEDQLQRSMGISQPLKEGDRVAGLLEGAEGQLPLCLRAELG